MPLTEEHRKKLDGIVQQMVGNKESDQDIQFVVNDFKNKYEQSMQPQPITGMQESGVLRQGEPRYMEYLRQAPRTVGGIFGGIVGAPGGIPGVLAGISAGAMGGELLEQARRYMTSKGIFGQPSQIEQRHAPQSVPQVAWEVGKAGLEEPAYQLVGAGAMKGVGKVLAPFAKKVSPESQQAIQFLKDKIKPVLTPSEATDSRALDIFENIAEGSLFGGGKISQFKLNRQKVLNDVVDDIVDKFGKRVSSDELGQTFEKVVEGKWKSVKAVTGPLYETASAMADETGAKVSTRSLKEFSKPLLDISKEIKSIGAKNAGDDLVKTTMLLPDEISFSAAKELRSRLISRIDEFNVINKKAPAIGRAAELIKRLDGQIEKDLGKASPDALDIWREANQIYKTGQKQYNNTFLRRLIKKADPDFGGEPEAIGKIVFRPGAISYVKQIKSATDPYTFKQFQSYYLQTLISKSVDDGGNIIGNKMIQNMYGKTGTGENVLRELFDEQTLKYITNFANTAKVAQTKSTEGTGKMWIQLTQAGAAGTMMGMGNTPAAGAILVSPAVLSRVLLNPTTVQLLTTGYTLPASAPMYGGMVSRTMGAIYRAEQEYKAMRDRMEE